MASCFRQVVIFIITGLMCLHAAAQCNISISSFPYNNDFEDNAAGDNWLSGGTFSDWNCGTPSKSFINAAGSGFRCWITGKLTGNSYNNNENSWLQSPCFNFSSLQHPKITFLIYWETENKYDGASLQYSTDVGVTWSTLGSTNDVTNCIASNWFNSTAITSLSGAQGWSGTVLPPSGSCGGGNGSGGWVLARHDLYNLAGKTNVMFRFVFGAGSICNDFNGFAVDNVTIDDALVIPGVADFSYLCNTNNNVSFIDNSSYCVSGYAWNFDDPSSGSLNTSTVENPSHTFSSGSHNVTLVVTFSNGTTATKTKTINFFDVSASVASGLKCNGDSTGILQASVNNAPSGISYNWSTIPVQTTTTATHVPAGTYFFTVSGTSYCSTTATATITNPPAIQVNINTVDVTCGSNGSAQAVVSGGLPPYQFLWSTGATTIHANNLVAGYYSFKVTDANNCKTNIDSIKIINTSNTSTLEIGNDTAICNGQQLILSAGHFAHYQWQDGSTDSVFTVTKSGKYWVTVVDVQGCTLSDTINVTTGDCKQLYFPTAFTPNKDGLNDSFGPLGNLGAVKGYLLNIYNRWGKLIFTSTDPYKKWNGSLNGNNGDFGTYVWYASYSFNGMPTQFQKGTINLLR
jgi:gliding motility-associated-like protein